MIIALLYIACQGDTPQPNSTENTAISIATTQDIKFTKERLRPSDHVLCVDTDNDGVDEGLFFHDGQLHTELSSIEISGGVQDWVRDESSIWIATGFSKKYRDAPMSVYRYSKSGLETHWTENAQRNQITDLSLVDGKLYMAKFSTGTNIHGGWLEQTFQPIVEANMAMQQKPLPETPDKYVVGRLYGDEVRSDGDLTIWNQKAKTRLKNFRGVRAMEIVDLNQDGFTDLLVADGWHYQYAKMGQARLSLYLGPDFTDKRVLTILDDEYSINHLEVHRNGKWILAQGTSSIYLLQNSSFGWKTVRIGSITETTNSTFCYTNKNSYVLTSGTNSIRYNIIPQ